MLTELSFSEASLLHEKLIKDGPDVLARLVSRVSDEQTAPGCCQRR